MFAAALLESPGTRGENGRRGPDIGSAKKQLARAPAVSHGDDGTEDDLAEALKAPPPPRHICPLSRPPPAMPPPGTPGRRGQGAVPEARRILRCQGPRRATHRQPAPRGSRAAPPGR
jgi:hypothetical protein